MSRRLSLAVGRWGKVRSDGSRGRLGGQDLGGLVHELARDPAEGQAVGGGRRVPAGPGPAAAPAAAPRHQSAALVVWARTAEYSGEVASRCAWVPVAATRPSSSRMMRWARAIVETRWAMTIVVRSRSSSRRARVDLGLDVHVDGARRVVEDQDGRVDQQCARDGDALALAARERVAPLADHGVVALGELEDEVVGARRARRGLDLLVGGVGQAVGDVVADRRPRRGRARRCTTPTLARRDDRDRSRTSWSSTWTAPSVTS